MAANSGNNNSPYFRRYLPTPAGGVMPGTSTGTLPPASELLSPSMSYTAKVGPRHAIHSVASPSTAPPSPYIGTPNTYHALTEPGTPAFLNPASADPVPSPSYESMSSPASNHVNQSAGSTKPSTPLADCRGSPISNGVYNPGVHYPPQHYYQPAPPYQRLPPVDSLPTSSTSSYYANSGNHVVGSYGRPQIERPSHPLPPGAYLQHVDNGQMVIPDPVDYANGPQDYYGDSYVQPSSSPAQFNSHAPVEFPPQPSTPQSTPLAITSRPRVTSYHAPPTHIRQPTVKQQLQHQLYHQSGRSTSYVQQPTTQPLVQHPISTCLASTAYAQPLTTSLPHGPVVSSPVNSTAVHSTQSPLQLPTSQGPPPQLPVLYVPRSTLGPPPTHVVVSSNGTHVQTVKSPETLQSNAKTIPVSTPAPADDSPTKTKPPKPKRVRKTAAQRKAEIAAAAEAAARQAASTTQPMDIVITRASIVDSKDSSHLLMPPPKLAQAPSVVAATAKTPNPVVVSKQQPISHASTSTYSTLPPTTSTANMVVPPSPQPKRQRAPPSQRTQQQRARQLKQQELERARLMEERVFLVKSMHLRKTVRALVFKNGALADEVARLKMQMDICKEETKLVAKRVQHHERNRIRRAQTQERKALARAAAAATNQNPSVDGASSRNTDDDNSVDPLDVVIPLNDMSIISALPPQQFTPQPIVSMPLTPTLPETSGLFNHQHTPRSQSSSARKRRTSNDKDDNLDRLSERSGSTTSELQTPDSSGVRRPKRRKCEK